MASCSKDIALFVDSNEKDKMEKKSAQILMGTLVAIKVRKNNSNKEPIGRGRGMSNITLF